MSALDVEHKMRRMLISLKRFGCGEEIITVSAMMLAKVNASILFRQRINADS